jgi:hypothetical protein
MGEGRGNDRFTLIFFWSKLILVLAPFFLYSQDTPKPAKEKKEKEPLLEYNGNLYKVHASYLNVGAGICNFPKQKETFTCFGIGYNFRFKDRYYKVGYEQSGNISYLGGSNQYLNDIHVAIGKRYPELRYNFSYFVGGSYMVYHDLEKTIEERVERGIGLYGEASAIFKPVYDIGFGVTGYTNLNFTAPVIGLRLDLYFSGAYKGKKEGSR